MTLTEARRYRERRGKAQYALSHVRRKPLPSRKR